MERIIRIPLAALLVLLALVVTAAAAITPGAVIETGLAPDGTSLTRCVTISESPLIVPDTALPSAEGSRGADGYLWLDLNHMNAVAENVTISGDGQYGAAGWWLNNKRFAVYQVAGGSGTPDWTRPMPAAQFQIAVDANDTGDRLVTTARGESLYVCTAASAIPLFSDWFMSPLVGYKVGVSDTGNTFAGASGDPSGTAGELGVYDGATETPRFRTSLPAPPEGVSVSGDGLVVAANTRTFVKIWDAMTGALRDSIPIAGETQTPAVLSGDGAYVVTGGFYKTVKVYHWDGTGYVLEWSHNIPGTTWITSLAVSRDGSTIVAGTWTNAAHMSGKVLVYDSSSSTPLWVDSGYGDTVAGVAVTADGGRIAAGSWGAYGLTQGNIITVYDRAAAVPIHAIGDDAITGVGSCMAIDIDADGHYLLAGGKAVHAREMGSGGWTMALQLSDPSDVADDTGRPATWGIAAAPNPFSGSLRLSASGVFHILSADGRVLRSLDGSEWDGRDAGGRDVPAGIYYIRSGVSGQPVVRVVRIR
jgi:hypothetical protein